MPGAGSWRYRRRCGIYNSRAVLEAGGISGVDQCARRGLQVQIAMIKTGAPFCGAGLRAHPGAGYRQRDRHCRLHGLLRYRTGSWVGMPPAVGRSFFTLGRTRRPNGPLPTRLVDTVGPEYSRRPSPRGLSRQLVLVMIPFIVVMGLKHARPLALQFSRLRDAAKDVAEGQFGKQSSARMHWQKWSMGRGGL